MMKKEDHLTQIGPGLGFNQSFFNFNPCQKFFFEISDFNQISNLAQKN